VKIADSSTKLKEFANHAILDTALSMEPALRQVLTVDAHYLMVINVPNAQKDGISINLEFVDL